MINRGHLIILLLQLLDPGYKACLSLLVAFLDELHQVIDRPEGILSILLSPRQLEDIFKLLQVIRDIKGIFAVFITEEVNDGVIPSPGYG